MTAQAHKQVSPKRTALLAAAAKRILVLDGAMGTMIQGLDYDAAAFRGERLKDFHRDVRGNNNLLILTQPKAIEDIHADYLRAGADIVATNTFSSTSSRKPITTSPAMPTSSISKARSWRTPPPRASPPRTASRALSRAPSVPPTHRFNLARRSPGKRF